MPPLDSQSDVSKRMVEALNRGLSEDVVGEYIGHLQAEVGVTINRSALNQVVSGGAGSADLD